uniref:DUF4371 domain-containing protein n=1 Tax=Latimeria chalumnae TaxID=7897 RepID=H2ZTC6_LATCH
EKGKHGPDVRGCSSRVNFLSKSMVNIILIRSTIAKELGFQKYSIQIDSTQDVSVVNQAMIVLRYYGGRVVHVYNTSGKGLHNSLKVSLESSGIPLKNIMGHSFDGAANMRSSSIGLKAFIKEAVPNGVYVWCYAHVLNLCIADTVSIVSEAKSVFGLLHRTAIFTSKSHTCIDAWKDNTGDTSGAAKFKYLQKIGETWWWSKYKALKHIFGTFKDSIEALYATLVCTLIFLSTSKKFDSKTSSEASSLLENFVKFQIVLTAFIFLKMFETYLQMKGLDYISAWSMVKQAKAQKFVDDFSFLQELDETSLGIDIENDIPEKRILKKKRMAREKALHKKHKSSLDCLRVDMYNTVLDQAPNSMEERFDQNRLTSDTSCLDPRWFDQIVTEGLPGNSLPEFYVLGAGDDYNPGDENESDSEEFMLSSRQQKPEKMKDKFESKLNLHTSAHSLLFITYEYVLCLSFIQLSCERAFSYLKLIKTRLRFSLSNSMLEAFMLMAVDRNLLESISEDSII